VPRPPKRKIEARRRQREVAFGFGMFGLVGWAVATPMVIGLLLGLWADSALDHGHAWTVAGLLGGLTLGLFNAWYWIARERRKAVEALTSASTTSSDTTPDATLRASSQRSRRDVGRSDADRDASLRSAPASDEREREDTPDSHTHAGDGASGSETP